VSIEHHRENTTAKTNLPPLSLKPPKNQVSIEHHRENTTTKTNLPVWVDLVL
jgi:hypothetical protein